MKVRRKRLRVVFGIQLVFLGDILLDQAQWGI